MTSDREPLAEEPMPTTRHFMTALSIMLLVLLGGSAITRSDFPISPATTWQYTLVTFLLVLIPFGYVCGRLTNAGLNVDESSSPAEKRRFKRWLLAVRRRYPGWAAAIQYYPCVVGIMICVELFAAWPKPDDASEQHLFRLCCVWFSLIALFCTTRLFARPRFG